MKEEAIKLLAKTDETLLLGKKGLARVTETNEVEKELKTFLNANLDFDSELGREYEKWSKTTIWKTIPGDGFANQSYISPIIMLRDFLTRFLDVSDIQAPPTQQYVKTGEVYTGRKVLRDILSRAKNKIDVQDNYLDQEIFAILQPYFENNANIEVRLLTNQANNAFKSDFDVFSKQYGRAKAKYNNQAHIRLIILDSNEVFSIGHSLKDVGKKADAVSKIEDDDARKKAIDDFESWWKNGTQIN